MGDTMYVARGADGAIVEVADEPAAGLEAVELRDPELLAFLAASDLELARVLEDLVDLLAAQGLLRFTDLPLAAQRKLLSRRSVRDRLGEGESLLVEEDLPEP